MDTHRTAEHLADLVGCEAEEVLVCSTGIIGVPLNLITWAAGMVTIPIFFPF